MTFHLELMQEGMNCIQEINICQRRIKLRKDCFKNKYQNDMTAYDLNCGRIYCPKWKGNLKRLFRRMARKRLKRDLDI